MAEFLSVGSPTAAAPWWGVPVVAGGFLLLGAILGFLFNLSLEQRRHLRTERMRWDADLRKHAADLLAVSREILQARMYRVGAKAGMQHAFSALERALRENDERDGTNWAPAWVKVMRDEETKALKGPMFTDKERQEQESWESLQVVRAEISLVAPPSVYRASDLLVKVLSEGLRAHSGEDPSDEALAKIRSAEEAFVQAIRLHLRVGVGDS